MVTALATDFPPSMPDPDASPVFLRIEPMAWWEEPQEHVWMGEPVPSDVRKSRAAAWRARHQTMQPVRCGDYWPPIFDDIACLL